MLTEHQIRSYRGEENADLEIEAAAAMARRT